MLSDERIERTRQQLQEILRLQRKEKRKKKNPQNSLNPGLLFHRFHFPQSDLFTSTLSSFTGPLRMCSISPIFHFCSVVLLLKKQSKSDLMNMLTNKMQSRLQIAHLASLLSHAPFFLAVSFPFHSTSNTCGAGFCPTKSLPYDLRNKHTTRTLKRN